MPPVDRGKFIEYARSVRKGTSNELEHGKGQLMDSPIVSFARCLKCRLGQFRRPDVRTHEEASVHNPLVGLGKVSPNVEALRLRIQSICVQDALEQPTSLRSGRTSAWYDCEAKTSYPR